MTSCLVSVGVGLNHIDSLIKPKDSAKHMGTLEFEGSDANPLVLLKRMIRVGTRQTGQFFDMGTDLRHAPLIIKESRCNANTKAVSIAPEKLQDKVVLIGRNSQILKREDATRYRSACVRLSYLAQDRLDFAETAKQFPCKMSAPREFDSVPLKRAARYLVRKTKAAILF